MRLLLYFLLISGQLLAQQLHPADKQGPAEASFRGLSVVDDSVAWVSGSRGWTGITTNGGKDWTFAQVKGFEKFDFRSLYAFNSTHALIAVAGSPASILQTLDGGKTWRVVYTNADSAAFFDGIGFWGEKDGIIYGDPVQGRMLLLRTSDNGTTWKDLSGSSPVLEEGEASFAASGTTIRCLGDHKVLIATGGRVSRLWVSDDNGLHWEAHPTPIMQGLKSTGIFSIACRDESHYVITGGDYLRDTLAINHVFYTLNAGKDWQKPVSPTRGYRECTEYLDANRLISTGPRGTDISTDGGNHWNPLSDDTSYHVVRKARRGSLVIIAGGKGKIGVFR